MRRVSSTSLVVAVALAAAAGPLRAQAIGQGYEYERLGKAAEAAQVYLATLRGEPANVPALLGLERVLPPLNRLIELLPLVQHARAVDTGNPLLKGLELRVYAGLNEMDSVDAVARRWVVQSPQNDAPYREWLIALEDARDLEGARAVIALARTSMAPPRPGLLAIEAAELEQRAGNWEGAAKEWGAAVSATPALLPNAASQLEEAPAPTRPGIVQALGAPEASAAARRLAAELLIDWGEPLRGWALLETTLAPTTPEAVNALRRFADLAIGSAPEMRRARGLALARYADLIPDALASRVRADAARALLDGGDRAGARTVLERLAGDSSATPEARALARSTLIEILVADNQPDLASARLAELGDRVSGDDRITLVRAIARARVRRGELDLADSALRGDSSVDGMALRGWIALYRGDLKQAVELFRSAGPYAGDRRDATERTAALALLQGIREQKHAALGAALLKLATGDSVGAVPALRAAAGQVASEAGRAEVLLLAGRIAARPGGEPVVAGDLLAEAMRVGGTSAAAPAAELEWARLLLGQGRGGDAMAHLEHLILTYPGSAVVPEARRELERARGAIPRS